MAGGTRIIAFDSASADAAKDEFLLTETVAESPAPDWSDAPAWDAPEEVAPVAAGRDWLTPLAAGLVILGWTLFYAWVVFDRVISGATPGQWVQLIRDWSVPVLLVGVAVLVMTRNSRREGQRFGAVARLLSEESARLETRLVAVNRELSLAREFISAQSRDLETLGRLAAERLSTEADRLQNLIRDNHARVETIGSVSGAALDNMEKLRGQLPVIASSAKDVTNNIGNAGRTAHSQLQEMINGFKKLNEFGQASERQVHVLRDLVDDTVAEFGRQTEQFGTLAESRFTEFRENGAAFRTELDSHEIEALAAVRSRATAMMAELEATRRQLDGAEAESLTSMRARLSGLREEGAAIARALREGESRAIEGWQASVARMREDLQATLVLLQDTEADAADGTRSRIAAIGDELARLDQQALDSAGRFAAQIEQRQSEAAAAEDAAGLGRREQLAAIDRELADRRTSQDQFERRAAEALRSRFAAIDGEMAERVARHEAQGAALIAQAEAVAAQLETFETRVAEIAAHGGKAEQALGASLRTLEERMAASRMALTGTNGTIASLTDASVRLLELIQASVQHSGEDLPRALNKGEAQLQDIEGRMAALRQSAEETEARGVRLAGTVESASETLRGSYAELTSLQAGLEQAGSAHAETLAGLRRELDLIAGQSAHLTDETRTKLAIALDELSRSTRETIAGFGESGSAAVSSLARQMGSESAAAIEGAMRTSATETASQLEQAVTQAASVSREAALQLRDQFAKVNELAGNLESRVAHARQRAEEQVDNDFTRRVALITESLNSNAIDIAKALSTDVSDTAWAAYLRGDRGIFTRRAVSLVDGTESKTIVQLYERDGAFHEHVSRYIHDFEAMLRQVLSARDGQALGVTLLSSDMGKLYVVLAQAIERLRN